MTTGKFRVVTEELKKSSAFILDKTSRYEAEYAKIYAEIGNLKVDWQGEASEAFNKQIEGYRNDFKELSKILRSYSEFLKTVANNYEKTEADLATKASHLSKGR